MKQIESLKSGSKFKKTSIGMMPVDWNIAHLGDLCIGTPEYGANASAEEKDETLPRYIRITDITEDGYLIQDSWKSIKREKGAGYLLKVGDFLFARTGATVGKTYQYNKNDGECAFAGYLIKFKPDSKQLFPKFLFYYTHSPYYYSWVKNMLRAGAQPNINAKEYSKLLIPLPPQGEQKKIIEILTILDEAIQKTDQIIQKTAQLKKGLMQQLLTKGIGHKEFKKTTIGEIPVGWEAKPLGSLVKKTIDPVQTEIKKEYRQIGIFSHGKGLFHKAPVTGKQLGNKRVFWVMPGCLVLNIVFAWEGAVTTTSEAERGLIASHRFPMFKPDKNRIDLEFLKLYFHSAQGNNALKSVSPGGAGRNKTLNQGDFLRLLVPLPGIKEQKLISKLITRINSEHEKEIKFKFSLENLKLGLMDKLLTGKKRLKNNIWSGNE